MFTPHYADFSGLSPTAGKPWPLISPLQSLLYVWRLFLLDCAHLYVTTCTCVYMYRHAWMRDMRVCIHMSTPFASSLGTFGRQEAGLPHAAFQGLPTQACPAEGVPEWGLKNSPGTVSQCHKHQTYAPAGVLSQRKENLFITGPPRGSTSCKLLGQREC